MLRIRPTYRTTTETEVLPPLAPQRLPEPVPILPWGEGTAVQEGPGEAPEAHPLPPEQAQVVHSRLAAINAAGCEAKIRALVSQLLHAQSTEELRGQIETWTSQFTRIDPRTPEKRALSIATLVFRVLQPALVYSRNVEEQNRLLGWEDSCREIVQQLLPDGSVVDQFMEESELGLREEKLFRERCERVDLATQMVLDALNSTSQTIDAQIEQALASIKTRLLGLQKSRRAMHHTMTTELAALDQQVCQLQDQIRTRYREKEALANEEALIYRRLYAGLDECKKVLEELL